MGHQQLAMHDGIHTFYDWIILCRYFNSDAFLLAKFLLLHLFMKFISHCRHKCTHTNCKIYKYQIQAQRESEWAKRVSGYLWMQSSVFLFFRKKEPSSAFLPKSHWVQFYVTCIDGSRRCCCFTFCAQMHYTFLSVRFFFSFIFTMCIIHQSTKYGIQTTRKYILYK